MYSELRGRFANLYGTQARERPGREDRPLCRVGRTRRRHPEVQVTITLEMIGLDVNEVCRDAQVRHQLPLHAGASLECAGVLEVLIDGQRLCALVRVGSEPERARDLSQLFGCQHGELTEREAVQIDPDQQQLTIHGRIRVPGRHGKRQPHRHVSRRHAEVVHRIREQQHRRARVIDAAVAAHDRLSTATRVPGKTDARSELIELIGDLRRVDGAADRELEAAKRVEHELVVGGRRRVERALPPQTVVEGEVAGHAPRVLAEERDFVG